MNIILLTRILMTLYSIACFAMLVRLIGLKMSGQKMKIGDVSNVLLFPIVILTKSGRAELSQTLTEENKK